MCVCVCVCVGVCVCVCCFWYGLHRSRQVATRVHASQIRCDDFLLCRGWTTQLLVILICSTLGSKRPQRDRTTKRPSDRAFERPSDLAVERSSMNNCYWVRVIAMFAVIVSFWIVGLAMFAATIFFFVEAGPLSSW